MKDITIESNQWNCIVRGIKIFEEIFIGMLIVGTVFLVYNWMQVDQLPFAALLQLLFIASWIGVIGLVGSIVLATLFFVSRRKLCHH